MNTTKRGGGESWISDSGTTESMTPDAAGFDNYEIAPPGHTVDMDGGTLLLVDKDRADSVQARELTLRRAARVPGLRYNFLSSA